MAQHLPSPLLSMVFNMIKKNQWKFIAKSPIQSLSDNTIYASSNNKYWIVKRNNEIHYDLHTDTPTASYNELNITQI